MRTLPRFIGLLQVDSTVGNLTGNASRIERLASIAKEHGAAMAVSTELASVDILQEICYYNQTSSICPLTKLHH